MMQKAAPAYTGEVVVGGAPAVRELRGLRMTKVAVGSYNNTYLLECTTTGERLMIDAAAESGTLLELVGTGGLGQVLPTHFHFDHWGPLAEVVNRTEATTLAHPAATVGIPVPTGNAVRDGRFIVKGTPREKGVDVRCALTFVREARQPDIDLVILASHDSDLDPALDEAAALGMAKVETFCWVDPQRKPGRG